MAILRQITIFKPFSFQNNYTHFLEIGTSKRLAHFKQRNQTYYINLLKQSL